MPPSLINTVTLDIILPPPPEEFYNIRWGCIFMCIKRLFCSIELHNSVIFLTTGRNPKYWSWGAKVYTFLLESNVSVRNVASSALDICYVAAGRSEGCIYANLTTIDIVAAIGILKYGVWLTTISNKSIEGANPS